MPTYFNTTEQPVRYDDDGRVVDGLDWVVIPRINDVAKAAVERGELLKFDSKGNIVDNKEETTKVSD